MTTVDAMMTVMRNDIANEVKAEVGQDIVDRVIKVVVSHLQNLPAPNLHVQPQINVLPAELHPEPTQVFVTNDLDLSELHEAISKLTEAMQENSRVLMMPVRRDVHRDADGNITTMIEQRM